MIISGIASLLRFVKLGFNADFLTELDVENEVDAKLRICAIVGVKAMKVFSISFIVMIVSFILYMIIYWICS